MVEPKIKESLLPKFSISRPVTVAMLFIAILVIGFIGYYRIKLDLFPSGMNNPELSVYIPYRNANPKEIEEQIVRPIEGEFKTVKSVKRVYSNSSSNGCFFYLEFAQGTNMDLAYAQVSDRLERSRPNLPDDVEYFYIRRQREDDIPIVYMGISYDDTVSDPFYVIDKHVKNAVTGVNGVASVELFGLRERYIQIIIDSDKVKMYKVNLSRVMGMLQQDNFAMSSGYTYIGEKKFLLRVSSRFKTLSDIQNIELGKGIKLSHIANIVYDFDEERRSIMRVDGNLAAGMVVQKESAANTVEVCSRVVDKLNEQFKNRPELKGVSFFVFWNQGDAIEGSIDNVKETGLWGGMFAFLVLFFFLRQFRITVILTLAIPLSLLITVLVIYFMGWTLNTITMMGLMLSIGLVVDNAIVVTENIYRFNSLKFGEKRSAILGASEVGLAITLATLTTIVVFLPLIFMGGQSNMSFILMRLGGPVIIALIASLFIALVFIPVSSKEVLSKGKAFNVHSTHNPLVQLYQTALVRILKNRSNSVFVISLLILSMFIPFGMMNKSQDGGGGTRDAQVIINFPTNYSLEKRDQTVDRISKKLMERDHIYHIDHLSSRVNKRWGRVEIYLKPNRDKQWYQVILRKVTNLLGISNYRKLTKEELSKDIKDHLPVIPGVRMRTSWRDQSGQSSSVNFTLRGYDTDVLLNITDELEKQMKGVEGVISIEDAAEDGNDEIHITVDREKAYRTGSNPSYIASYVAFSLRPRKITNYHSDEKEIPVYVKFKEDQRQNVNQLKNLLIRTDSDVDTTLSSVSGFSYHKSLGRIRREDGKSFLELKVFIEDENKKEIRENLQKLMKDFKYPTGYYYEQGRDSRRYEEQNTDLINALILSVVMVFIIMGILFESFVLPLSILVAIPAAFVGSFWLLFITGTTFEIMAGIGLIILIGVVVNNGIVLIDLVNQYRKTGMNREQAIIVAGMHRFRPIMMTALTTIFGLIPMAIGNASLIGTPYSPMGVTMIGGLVSSTFLTLFAVPIFYTYFDDMRVFFKKLVDRFF